MGSLMIPLVRLRTPPEANCISAAKGKGHGLLRRC